MEGYSIQTVLSSLLLNMLNIIVLFLLIRSWVYRPVRKYMRVRSERIAEQLEKAKTDQEQADALLAQYQSRMSVIEDTATKLRLTAQHEAEQKADEILDQARKHAAQLEAEAQKRADVERNEKLLAMEQEISGMAVDIAARILQREVSEADNAAIIDAYFTKRGEVNQ